MTPDQVSALTAIAAIVSKIGTWPIGSIAAVIVLGPWIFAYMMSNKAEKRHEAVIKMYEDNVQLVKDNAQMVTNYEKIADEQADTIRLSTGAIMELTAYLKIRPTCHERRHEVISR